MEHAVSIVRPDWSSDHEDTWLNVTLWRSLVASTPDLQLTDRLPNIDPRDGRLVDELRPNTAQWTGHPSGVPFIFLWRIGRLEVGAIYPEENGGTTFALTRVDSALQERCASIAAALGAGVDHDIWARPGNDAHD